MEERALRNYEKYFNKPEGSATVGEVESMPGGVEEWSKEDVLDIVVGGSDKSMKGDGLAQSYKGAGAINQSTFVEQTTDFTPRDSAISLK